VLSILNSAFALIWNCCVNILDDNAGRKWISAEEIKSAKNGWRGALVPVSLGRWAGAVQDIAEIFLRYAARSVEFVAMKWISEMPTAQPVAWAVFVLMIVAAAGLSISNVQFKGIKVGIIGVLFAGILIGHFGMKIEPQILDFAREFGLILFVFTIGLQMGPGFFRSFRKQGVKLNFLAFLNVMLGVALAAGAAVFCGIHSAAALGIFSGASINTPSLGATQQMVKNFSETLGDKAALPGIAYAVTYPGGVFGIIIVLLILRKIFRIDPVREVEAFRLEERGAIEPLDRMNLVVENPNLENLSVRDVPGRDPGVAVSRIKRAGAERIEVATELTVLHRGDVILAVGTRKTLEKFRITVGSQSGEDLIQLSGPVASERMVVTSRKAVGRTIESLSLSAGYGATITRVTRGDVELTAVPELRLEFGDIVQVVAGESTIGKVGEVLGNRLGALNETQFVPIFIGIVLGVLVGCIPISIPGMPVAVRLGIAGGPLIVAIFLGSIGRIGPLVMHLPRSANLAFREFGIVLFLAAVGLRAGDNFFETAFTSQGLRWLLIGICITIIPPLTVGIIARGVLKLNFTVISGTLAGSMTDPSSLAFANAACKSDAPAVFYAAVYPLTMLLRVISVQILAVIFWR
jgi:putative transport protein